MLFYTIRRLLAIIPLLLGVVLITMLLPRLIPGDVVTIMLGSESVVSPQRADEMRRLLGLDRSLPEQYVDYLSSLVRGDMGRSLRTGQPVAPLIAQRFTLSLYVSLLAILMGTVVGVSLGILAARYRKTRADVFLRIFNLLGLSIPRFWVATLLLLAATFYLHGVFPTVGAARADATLIEKLRYAFLPGLTLAIPVSAVLARITQSAMTEVLVQDYIAVARAKGLMERAVFYKHALRNALIPIVTEIGLQAGFIFGGIVEVEVVFSYPGVGLLALNAISQRDYPVLQGVLLTITLLFALINLLVDLSYAWLNPKIRYS
jgi:peptide/nickel transport system permease protein